MPSGISSKIWDAYFYDPQDQPNYLTVDIIDEKMVIKAFKQDGTLMDDYLIDKSNSIAKTVIPPKYNQTQLVLFGDRLHEPFIKSHPKKLGDKWYVPIIPFIEYLGGRVYVNEKNINLVYEGNDIKMNSDDKHAIKNGSTVSLPDNLEIDKQDVYISADNLKTLFGFSYKYDAKTNMLMFI